ncbi:MAG: hypothetical protein J5806_09140 [Lentisphaeria bacterium]|nr:hypothetical protein [Lentisphaeria bacterium]
MDRKTSAAKVLPFLKKHWPECLTAAVAAAVWGLLFDRFLLNDIDDTWTTSWIYYFIRDGQTRDLIFMEQVPEYWGVRFFSHIFCWICGAVLSVIGFTRSNVHLLSNLWMLGGLALWYQVGKRVWQDRKQAAELVLLLALSTIVVSAANKGRSDAFIFFLQSASLVLFAGKHYFSALLTLCLAVETHPIGILGGCYLAAWTVVYDRDLLRLKDPSGLFRLIAGGLAGLGIYLLLHASELRNFGTMLDSMDAPANFLLMHFFGREHFAWRYWPDLALFLAAAVWSLIRLAVDKKNSFALASTLFLLAGSLVIRRGNFHYALFCYPAFLMLAGETFGHFELKRIPLLLVLWAGLQLPQFLYLIHRNLSCRDYAVYQKFLSETEFPADAVICGHPADWFGLQKYRGFRSLTHFHPPKSEFYLIQHNGTRYQQPDIPAVPAENLQMQELRSIRLPSGGTIRILKAKAKPAAETSDGKKASAPSERKSSGEHDRP